MTLYRNPLTGAMESEEEMRGRPPELHGETVLPAEPMTATEARILQNVPIYRIPESLKERLLASGFVREWNGNFYGNGGRVFWEKPMPTTLSTAPDSPPQAPGF